jgi:hypothetical protein
VRREGTYYFAYRRGLLSTFNIFNDSNRVGIWNDVYGLTKEEATEALSRYLTYNKNNSEIVDVVKL